MKQDYSTFDAAVLEKIGEGINTAGNLMNDVAELAAQFCDPHIIPFRFLDRRLQALKLAGKIRYDRRTGWKLT